MVFYSVGTFGHLLPNAVAHGMPSLEQAALYSLPPHLILTVDAIDAYLPHVPDSARAQSGRHALAARTGNAEVVHHAQEVIES
ncbi:hypothetical protein P4N68_06255 [Corynebacterium felinum]|uniref:Uncharacterized protein n=1 Tax=Corynebacterium felinum TaxID=131318 RepID=A0ABU2BFT3_9CORY|nr:hypothetical protein [Corynebacterium felinum]MDF5820682.1 hypothetical protein [Corynebacterium felinum]MDR7356254.1 hypothetical protein [Corynebacterium felinum]WJY95586.1 hypothetical protein CFELI_09925 [Corynebacterium felinum]